MIYPAQMIANYLIWRANSDEELGENISNLKLQKLLYYAQGFHLAINGAPLFAEPIEAWMHGPVVRSIYFEYKDYGASALPTPEDFDREAIDSEALDVIEEAYSVYGQYSAWGLRNLTHEEAPWKDAPLNGEISQESMRRYFAEHLVSA
jgi:uncharacterized phage-associated protein